MRYRFIPFCLLFLIVSCGSIFRGPNFRVGLDPSWLMTSSGGKAALITGFIEEVLLDISKNTGISFEQIDGNWDDLQQNLRLKRYDAIISSMPPYSFNKADYDFSDRLLATGPVLVVPIDSKVKSLKDLSNRTIGFIQGSPALLVLQTYTSIQIEPYTSIVLALNDLTRGKAQGALLDYLPAANLVKDLYDRKLKIVGEPLTQEGIRMVYMKGKHLEMQKAFEKSLQKLKKSRRYQELLKKWDLNSSL